MLIVLVVKIAILIATSTVVMLLIAGLVREMELAAIRCFGHKGAAFVATFNFAVALVVIAIYLIVAVLWPAMTATIVYPVIF